MSTVEPRIAYYKLAPDGIKHLQALERYLANCGLEKSLLELVKLRASQINGCAYCLDMHSKDALAAGETTQRQRRERRERAEALVIVLAFLTGMSCGVSSDRSRPPKSL